MSDNEEIWVDIEGFEKIYQVSNHGRVRSMMRTITRSTGKQHTLATHILPTSKSVHQVRVFLRNHYARTSMSVHLLVGKYFVPNPNNFKHLKHLDGNKHNNHYKNLEWYKPRCAVAEYRQKFGPPIKGAMRPKKSIEQICLETGQVIATWNGYKSIEIALGLSKHHISECCNGKRFTAFGYIWKFLDAIDS